MRNIPAILFLLIFLAAGLDSTKVLNFDVKSVNELNALLKEIEYDPNEELYVIIDFNYIIINKTIEFGSLNDTNRPLNLSVSIMHAGGFEVSPSASPLVLDTSLAFETFTFKMSHLNFYDKNGQILSPSCDDYYMSYFNLTKEQFQQVDMQKVIQYFKGTFAFRAVALDFFLSNPVDRPICPHVFQLGSFDAISLLTYVQQNFVRNEVLQFTPWDPQDGSTYRQFPLATCSWCHMCTGFLWSPY